jgi:serine/threonine-protein kinase
LSRRAADEPTVRAPPPIIEPTEIIRADEEDSENVVETVALDLQSAGPPAAGPLVPSQVIAAAGSGPRRTVDSNGARAETGPRRRFTPLPQELARRRRRKMIIAIAGLAGLTFLSFMIALAAKQSSPHAAAPARDAAVVVVAIDALPIAPPPPDAAEQPTVPVEDQGKAHLIVRTIPDGGTIKVGEQTRNAVVHPSDATGAASVELILDAGAHTVIAELAGYAREKRKVVLERGETQRIEISFQKRLAAARPDPHAKTGRLTVRTIPWSDVYLGSKKLGQAPFADLEMPVGTHKLTFKNPGRPTVTKTVTIQPGKSAKLNFNLP